MTKEKHMEQTYTIQENFVVDQASGEVLGEVVDQAGAISSQEALEAVLERIGNVESQLVALQARHSAIIENCKKLEKRKENYLAYLKSVYSSPIEEYAKARLEGGKSKTLTTPYGSVSFRLVNGGLKVTDATQALEYAQSVGFTNAIKLSATFQISKLEPAQRELLEARVPEGFEYSPNREIMSIKVVN
jgi:phage host-nuclease inhibitor protein Gam